MGKKLAAMGAIVVAAICTTGQGAGADTSDSVWRTPSSGPPGTIVTVSGADCPGGAVEAGLVDAESGVGLVDGSAQASSYGDWIIQLEVPDGVSLGQTLLVRAECLMDGAPTYVDREFVVAEVAPVLPMSVDPTSGPVGTHITVSGDGCTGQLHVGLYQAPAVRPDHSSVIVDSRSMQVDGPWRTGLWVTQNMFAWAPDQGYQELPVVPGDYFVRATCIPDDMSGGGAIVSEAVPFEVTGPGEAPPRAEPPQPPPAVPNADITLQAQPATPVVGDPDYTG